MGLNPIKQLFDTGRLQEFSGIKDTVRLGMTCKTLKNVVNKLSLPEMLFSRVFNLSPKPAELQQIHQANLQKLASMRKWFSTFDLLTLNPSELKARYNELSGDERNILECLRDEFVQNRDKFVPCVIFRNWWRNKFDSLPTRVSEKIVKESMRDNAREEGRCFKYHQDEYIEDAYLDPDLRKKALKFVRTPLETSVWDGDDVIPYFLLPEFLKRIITELSEPTTV